MKGKRGFLDWRITVVVILFVTLLSVSAFLVRDMQNGPVARDARTGNEGLDLELLIGRIGRAFINRDGLDKVGICYEIVDKNGQLITKMARTPYPGDQLLTPDGSSYVVKKVDEYTAVSEFAGRDKQFLEIVAALDEMDGVTVSGTGESGLVSKPGLPGGIGERGEVPVAALDWNKRPVAVYHTHSDESYLPSDGRISIPFNGGIFQVGNSITGGLKRNGAKALHDLTPHDPHDANAYTRSRKTAVSLIKNTNPAAIFDVHRDGIDDPEFYHVAEENFTQIRIVVGRQNPKMQANLEFARRLMAYANKLHPGIVKEIFMARGNYNQDLMSTALLFEAGTYTNYKSEAQKGIDFLAGAVPVVLGLTGQVQGPQQVAAKAVNTKSFLLAFGLILLVIVLAGAFIYLNAGPEEIEEYAKFAKDKRDYLLKKLSQLRSKNNN